MTLPIDRRLDEVVAALEDHGAVVVVGPPGSGKTTRVPPRLSASPSGSAGRVVMLEPRRVAARAAAARIAADEGARLGGDVGYQIRLDRRASRHTRILVVTEGILVRMVEDDPLLDGVSVVIVDEFHERSVHADLALAMVQHVRREVRPDLGVAVMSATMDPAPVAAFLGGCPVVRVSGRPHRVSVVHASRATATPEEAEVGPSVDRALADTRGHVLVFLPGKGEIRRAEREFAARPPADGVRVMPLHGDLPAAVQDAALGPSAARKVILATNVAETSLTIEGVTAVVDSGLERRPMFDPSTGLDRLELHRISRASAHQRAGRAGRTGPGVCVRMFSRAELAGMDEYSTPEIHRTDISGPVLHLLAWGEDPHLFGWFDHPGRGPIERALDLLSLLGAVAEGRPTSLGRLMARLPLHPRLARLVVAGHAHGHPAAAARLAAVMGGRLRPAGGSMRSAGRSSRSDPLDRLAAVEAAGAGGAVDAHAARFVLTDGERIARLVDSRLGPAPAPATGAGEALMRCLVTAYPDRLARRRREHDPRALMVGGRGVRLDERSAVRNDELFVCVDVDARRARRSPELRVRAASAAERGWLPPEHLRTRIDVEFDEHRQRVVARERTIFVDLVLDGRPARSPDPADVSAELAAAAARDPVRALGLEEPETRRLLDRLRFLASAMPELDLPRPDEAWLRKALSLLCQGRSSFAELRGPPLRQALLGLLTREQRETLDRHAPERLRVPSGSAIRLDYPETGPPVLPVRIQEMFGARRTPTVARGRVTVTLHLLAPNMRPQQVTQDLESFWRDTYPVVRKELRARYPKHAWPEDPLAAPPERRPSRTRASGR